MSPVRRRDLLAAGAAIGASMVLPRASKAFVAAAPRRPDQWFILESELPVLELDPTASAAKGRIMTRGRALSMLEWGAVIMVPSGRPIPARWWGLRVGRRTGLNDGARISYAVPTLPIARACTRLTRKGGLELQNVSDRRIKMQVEDLDIAAGTGGDAIRIASDRRG